MKDLGERIKQAIARIDAMQQELDRRLKELEKKQLQEASDFLWKYSMDHKEYMPEENYYEPDWAAYELAEVLHNYAQGVEVDIRDVQEAMELYTTLQQPTDYRETAEDTGIVKYTKGGLYDYGYNPSVDPEELPF
jgi:hypothetical protein